ncbi:hypothetical protein EV361DRAFT_871370 [Lentinula raphanica]|nr:hypothetical protein EV361DRAFT_871370 [Lentinula raphanica]
MARSWTFLTLRLGPPPTQLTYLLQILLRQIVTRFPCASALSKHHLMPTFLTPIFKPPMRAVVYEKPFSVSVLEVPKSSILHPDDVIVKGWTAAEPGTVFGHENMGIVEYC